MGQKLAIDGAQLFRVIQGIQHLPPRCIPNAKELLELSGREADYFDLIFAAAKTRNISKRNGLLDKAYSLRDVYRHKLSIQEMNLFSQWWFPPVLSFLEVTGGRANPREIAKQLIPQITEEQAEEAIAFLKAHNFIRKQSSGKFKLAQPHITASGPEKAASIRSYQKNAMLMGAEAIDRFPVPERNASTLTLAIDEECFDDICNMAQEFRRQVQKRIEEATKPDRVINLTMSIYPIAISSRKGSV
jgi:uncharacterized protein (TIGR02147 family)